MFDLNDSRPQARRGVFLVIALFAIAVLSPYLSTGYYVDDSSNSLLPAALQLKGVSFWRFYLDISRSWMFESGRLFPLGILVGLGVWCLPLSLQAYHGAQVAFVVADLFLFMAMVRALGGNRRLACFCALFVLGLFQLRNYHDPVASYAFMMQTAFTLGAGSLLFFLSFRRNGRAWAFWASLVLYLALLLLYETGVAFAAILLFVAFRAEDAAHGWRRWLARWAHLAVTGAYLAGVLTLRLAYPLAYNGTRSSFGLKAVITFFRQLSGALPLVYAFFGRSGFYTFGTLISRDFLTWGTLGIFLAASTLFFLTLNSGEPEESAPRTPPGLKILGWTLTLIPTVFVALSEKYQEGIDRPGMAYLPIYLSCFGVALLMGPLLLRARRTRVTAVVLGAILAFTYSTNQIAAGCLNQYWKYPRALVEAAFQNGLLAEVEPDARILRAESDSWSWARADFLLAASGKRNPVGELADSLKALPLAPQEKAYVVMSDVLGEGSGRVLLARIEQVEWDPASQKVTRVLISSPARIIDFSSGKAHVGWLKVRELAIDPPASWRKAVATEN